MSLKDLDALLKTPLGQKVPKKKKRRKKSSRASGVVPGKSEFLMRQIEEAQKRVSEWRLSAHPHKTIIVVQRTTCTGCGEHSDATISAPMTGYRDRLGRTHYQPNMVPSRDLPIEIKWTTMTVPICHLCWSSWERPRILVDSAGVGTLTEYQLSIRLQEHNHQQCTCTALVPAGPRIIMEKRA